MTLCLAFAGVAFGQAAAARHAWSSTQRPTTSIRPVCSASEMKAALVDARTKAQTAQIDAQAHAHVQNLIQQSEQACGRGDMKLSAEKANEALAILK